MESIRKILKTLKAMPTIEGAGVHLKRVFGYHQVPQLDPFLLLDDFGSNNPADYISGFPWHPHRGIETVTYLISGAVEHGDSLGNSGIISSGDVQWMTAGSGIVHQEMPKGEPKGALRGLQLWINLPAANKMMAPRYQDIRSEQIPEVSAKDGVKIKVLAGEVNGLKGPVRDLVIDPEYMDIVIPPQVSFVHPVKKGYKVFAYILQGNGYFEPHPTPSAFEIKSGKAFDTQQNGLEAHSLVIYADGDKVQIQAKDEELHFILVAGKPMNEPVAWYGPIVMNTQEELQQAFAEYENGTFIK